MMGAIYKKKGEERYIRIYSNNEKQIRKPLEQFELHKTYTDTRQMEREYTQLEERMRRNK